MKMRKGLLTVLLFVVALVVFSSCGDLAGDGDNNTNAGTPIKVTLEYKNNFEYKADAGYNAWAFTTNSNTLIVANVSNNGATITKVEFRIDFANGYTMASMSSEPYEFDYSTDWKFGHAEATVKVYYEYNSVSNNVTSGIVESYMYSPWYETCVATNTNGNAAYLFRADPEADFYADDLPTNSVTDVYISGVFDWSEKNPDYKMTKNGKYYEIILTNISAGDQYKYQIVTTASPDPEWLPDKANYWMVDDGSGGWNSVCHD